jgi:hemoglobin
MMKSLFDQAAGQDAAPNGFIDIFCGGAFADPIRQRLFGAGRPEHMAHLSAFEASSFGGPDPFTRGPGSQHRVDVHHFSKIAEEQRARFVELYLADADQAGLPDDTLFREALRSHAEFGARVAMQNPHAETDDPLHPRRHVPRWEWPA